MTPEPDQRNRLSEWERFRTAKHPYHSGMCVAQHPFAAHAMDPRYCRTCPHRPNDDCHRISESKEEPR